MSIFNWGVSVWTWTSKKASCLHLRSNKHLVKKKFDNHKQVVKYFFHKVKFLLHLIFFSVRTNLNNWRSSWLGWTCYFCATNNNNTLRLCLSNLFGVFKIVKPVINSKVLKFFATSPLILDWFQITLITWIKKLKTYNLTVYSKVLLNL